MSKYSIYEAIVALGGRATWAQIEDKLEGTGHDRTNLRAGITRLIRDGLVRWERSAEKARARIYIIAAPYPERNLWTLEETRRGTLVARRIEA